MEVPLGDTYYFKFTTRSFSTGAPATLSGTPVISVYEENNLTQITAGITLTADYDSVTGLNDVAVVATSGNGYEVGKYYDAVITTGTVGGVSVVGETVKHFRIVPAEDAGAGIRDVNVTHFGDTAATTSGGRPEVNTTHVGGTAQTANDNGADINAILVDTNSLNDTKIPDTISLANINAQVDTALADINLDHLVGTATGIPAVPAGTYLDQIMDDGTATFDRTTDSLQAMRDHVGDGTSLTEAGGTGDHLTAINLPNQTMDITGNITGNLSGSVGSVTTVNGLADNVITAASIAAGVLLPESGVALNDIPVLMVDETDGITPETGLTVTATKSIDGATTFSSTTGTVTEAANGIYHFDASAADMTGALITFKFSATGAADTFVTIKTTG